VSLGELFERESRAKATQICPHCGGPMTCGAALVTSKDSCGVFQLPAQCLSKACREARDDAAIARAVEAGVIDP
jgi:hypothetical protein